MTVRELIEALEGLDPDQHVYIGYKQRFGSDFAYSVEDVTTASICKFWGYDEDNAVCIVTDGDNDQIGTYSEED